MHQGSCLCGSVKYSIDDDLQFVVNCHCQFCSKAHGAAFTTLLIMPFNRLELVEGQTLLASYEVETLNSLPISTSARNVLGTASRMSCLNLAQRQVRQSLGNCVRVRFNAE
jgi:Glutathione-dependent formaldehyde-activating enzyme